MNRIHNIGLGPSADHRALPPVLRMDGLSSVYSRGARKTHYFPGLYGPSSPQYPYLPTSQALCQVARKWIANSQRSSPRSRLPASKPPRCPRETFNPSSPNSPTAGRVAVSTRLICGCSASVSVRVLRVSRTTWCLNRRRMGIPWM